MRTGISLKSPTDETADCVLDPRGLTALTLLVAESEPANAPGLAILKLLAGERP